MNSKLYHREVYFPEFVKNELRKIQDVRVSYSAHALHQANSDRYGKVSLPTVVPVHNGDVFEVETVGNKINKLCVRFPLKNRPLSIVFVILFDYNRNVVKTVWLNQVTDNHSTLNKGNYCNV